MAGKHLGSMSHEELANHAHGNDRSSDGPSHGHPGHTQVEGATRYADPEDKAYPLDTPEHRHAAASLFGMHKDNYSPEKRAEIEHNIEAAKKD